MHLPRSQAQVPNLRAVEATGSTNSDLLALAADPAIESFTAIATLDQRRGRGRLDRQWVAEPGAALAVSVLVRGVVAGPLASWVPLVAGLAMAEALDEHWPGRVGVKWPNDVLIGERKVCGILVETVAGSDAVIGAGLNLRQADHELPVPTAISLVGAGFTVDDEVIDGILASYLGRIRLAFELGVDSGNVRERVAHRCVTIGRRVRVRLPAAPDLEGTAIGLDGSGRLEVRADDGAVVALAVGDVIHVRAV